MEGSLGLDLDLAFTGFQGYNSLGILDVSTKLLLTKSEPWYKDLTHWIQLLRTDVTFSCPELIRQSSSFSMGLQFIDDVTITKLNAQWREKNEKTDVLSFPALDESFAYPQLKFIELGDIVISVPTALHQAKELNHSLAMELRWLVSHGFLHLLGWDHLTPNTLQSMLSCQKQLMQLNAKVQGPHEESAKITNVS